MKEGPIYLGVDIGGTKVAAGLVDAQGQVLRKTRVPMRAQGTAQEGLEAVKAVIGAMMGSDGQITGIGICSPGPLDPREGIVINPPNVPCWRNFPLAEEVQRAFRLGSVRVDNDANAAALAEFLWGAARGFGNVFYATIGTGIGTGIVFDGCIYHGRTGAAAEGGHVTIDFKSNARCGCGKRGCIEALASGTAIAMRARERAAKAGRESKLLQLAGGDVAAITTEMVAEAWRAGDPVSTEVLHETAEMIAIWLGNMIDLLEPDVIVLGGGAGKLMTEWGEQISETLRKWCLNRRSDEIPIRPAHYGSDSGIAGAAALCLGKPTRARVG